MNKVDKIVLENGLTIFLLNDNNKHTTMANLIVKFGGIDAKVKLNNSIYNLKSGLAHFLEHVVLESSEFGDLMKIFGSEGIRSNGLTSIEKTEFYIDAVNNFEENLELLIKGIHSPHFEDNIIEDIRKPILEEKRKSLDNKYSNLYNANVSTYINNKNYKSILGDIKDIKSINKKDLERVFNAFYRPINEVLIISGKFDQDKILDIIKNTYCNLIFDNNIFERIKFPLNDKVNKKLLTIKDNTNIGRTILSFKINITGLNSYDKVMFDTYVHSFLKMNFGVMSNFNINLVKRGVIVGNLSFLGNAIDGYYIIKLEANTNNKADFVNSILSYINDRLFIFDEDLFNLYKKGYIIDLIVRNDSIYSMLEPFIENLISFGYENTDKVEDIERMTFKVFKDVINDITFDNYSVTELKPIKKA